MCPLYLVYRCTAVICVTVWKCQKQLRIYTYHLYSWPTLQFWVRIRCSTVCKPTSKEAKCLKPVSQHSEVLQQQSWCTQPHKPHCACLARCNKLTSRYSSNEPFWFTLTSQCFLLSKIALTPSTSTMITINACGKSTKISAKHHEATLTPDKEKG